VLSISTLIPSGQDVYTINPGRATLIDEQAILLDHDFRQRVFDNLVERDRVSQAARFLQCGSPNFFTEVCGCGTKPIPFSCNMYRICEKCGDKRFSRIRWKLFHLLKKYPIPKHRRAIGLRLLTLTIIDGRSLAEAYEHLRDSFSKLKRSQFWKSTVKGYIMAIEAKPMHLESGMHWHVHAHMVVYSGYLPNDVNTIDKATGRTPLAEAWHEATGDSYIVDVSVVNTYKGASSYVLKYVTKGSAADCTAEELGELYDVMHGRRMLSTGGILHGQMKKVASEPHICDVCEQPKTYWLNQMVDNMCGTHNFHVERPPDLREYL